MNSKEVNENCQLIKVFENYLYLRNVDQFELIIWSITEDRRLITYKYCDLEGWRQVHSVPAFINLDELSNFVNVIPMKQYMSLYSEESRCISNGVHIRHRSIVDSNMEIVDFIEERGLVIYTDENS